MVLFVKNMVYLWHIPTYVWNKWAKTIVIMSRKLLLTQPDIID